jgi:CubicO group peptidase (beta-lactamase class C family)
MLRVVAALVVAGSGMGSAWGQPAPQPLAARAAAVLKEVADTAAFNGAVVLMRNGQVVYEGAVGLAQRDPDRPYTPDTPSDGGSLAKTMTAAAVWELVAEGRLQFDDRVVRHLPIAQRA